MDGRVGRPTAPFTAPPRQPRMTNIIQIQCIECSHRPPRFETTQDVKVRDGWPGVECDMCGGSEHFVVDVRGGA